MWQGCRRGVRSAVCAIAGLLLAGALAAPSAGADAPIRISPASGSFEFVDRRGDPSKRIKVYTYLPAGVEASAAKIVFVMHGTSRNADGYRDTWIPHAEKYRLMIIAPLFEREQWGPGGYTYRSVLTRDGTLLDRPLWSHSVIEHLFDAIREATGNRSERYYLYGHSEGGQFVHRLVLLLPEARYVRAVAANAGWYTMPDFEVKFPYGLSGVPVTKQSLRQSLARELIVLLGEQDVDSAHSNLRRSPPAMAQGANRLERGQAFMAAARERAAALDTTLRWRLEVVPGAAHQNSRMSGPAADLLMQ